MVPEPLLLAESTLVPAVFGLVGVIVGAAINGGVQYLLARGQEGNERRSHGRLVDADLQRAADVAKQYQGAPRRLSPAWLDDLHTPAWNEGRGILASTLDREDWVALRDAFDSIARFRRSLDTTDIEDPKDREHNVTLAKELRTKLSAAAERLRAALGEQATSERSTSPSR